MSSRDAESGTAATLVWQLHFRWSVGVMNNNEHMRWVFVPAPRSPLFTSNFYINLNFETKFGSVSIISLSADLPKKTFSECFGSFRVRNVCGNEPSHLPRGRTVIRCARRCEASSRPFLIIKSSPPSAHLAAPL